MGLTLLEAAKVCQVPLQRGVIEVFARTSPVLERIPFMNISGNSYRYNVTESLPGIAFRGINQSYTDTVGVLNPQVESLYIFGGISYTDRALVKTQGNVNDLRAIYDGMAATAAALTFTHKFFKGSNLTDPNEFDGLESRLTGSQKIAAGSTSSGDELTLSMVDILIDAIQGGPDVLFMNKTMRRKINSLMRAAGQAQETVSDAFGRQINAYAGIPIGVIESDRDGNEILDFDEECPGGGSDVGTSLYAVRFGVLEYVCGLQAGPMDVLDLGLNRTQYETLIEHIAGLFVGHPKAAARLYGVKNA